MSKRTSSSPVTVLIILFATMAAHESRAQGFQWPDEPENLQVLPEGTGGAELGKIMRGFATSLSVRCEHCHLGEGPDLTQFDFVADDKAAKQIARKMLEMVAEINGEHLAGLAEVAGAESPTVEVSCVTCHRGNAKPVMIENVLIEKISEQGTDAAIAEYRSLRDRYYGGFTYDFSAGMLTGLGEQLGNEGNFEAAISILELETEMNGESAGTYFSLGGVQVAAGLNDEARTTFSKGLAIAPDGWKPFFKAELDKLAAGQE